MSRRWFLAKYVDDLRRQEPRNIGVVLVTPEGATCRFLGDLGDGRTDGRSIRWMGSPKNIRAWIAYWRQAFAGARTDADLARIVARGRGSNLFVEPSGEALRDDSGLSDENFVDELFELLVRESPKLERLREPAALSLDDMVEQIFDELDVSNDVHRGEPYDVGGEQVFVDYWLDGHAPRLMSKIELGESDPVAWRTAQATAYAFERAREKRPGAKCIALVSPASSERREQLMLPMLATAQKPAEVVHLSDLKAARDQLAALLKKDAAE